MNALLNVDEAAKLLNCTPAAIRKWLYQRRPTRVKMGRLTRLWLKDVEAVAIKGLPQPGQAVQPVRRAARSRQEPRSGGGTPPSTAPTPEARAEPVSAST